MRPARPSSVLADEARVLALDPGERRIGVALSDPTGTIASPLTVLDARAGDLAERLRALCDEWQVDTIVVGLPVGLSGHEGDSADAARRLAAVAAEATGRRVELVDERYTTRMAEAALVEGNVRRRERRGKVDMVAAAVLLQGYLDARRRRRRTSDEEDGNDGDQNRS